jgi:hypothetical protein
MEDEWPGTSRNFKLQTSEKFQIPMFKTGAVGPRLEVEKGLEF